MMRKIQILPNSVFFDSACMRQNRRQTTKRKLINERERERDRKLFLSAEMNEVRSKQHNRTLKTQRKSEIINPF